VLISLFFGLLLSAGGVLPFGFSDLEIFKVGDRTTGLTAGDVNGDGLMDVLLIDNAKGSVTVLEQRSEKERVEPPPTEVNDVPSDLRFKRKDRLTERQLYALVTGDFNKDGKLDLAFHGDPPGLTIALGGSAWEDRRRLAVRNPLAGGKSLLAGDVDGDGRDDLLLLTAEGYQLWRWKSGPVRAGIIPVPAKRISYAALADLSGDGRKDLIYKVTGRWPIRVRLGRDGEFGPEIAFRCESLLSFVPGDLTQGKGDELVAVQDNPLRLSILSFKLRAREENFGDVHLYVAATGVARVSQSAVGDINGDGALDLVVLLPETAQVGVFFGKKKGDFEPLRLWPTLREPKGLVVVQSGGRHLVVVRSEREESVGVSRWDGKRLTFPALCPVEGKPTALGICRLKGEERVLVASEKSRRKTQVSLLEIKEGGEIDLGASASISGRVEDMAAADLDGDGGQEILCFIAYQSPAILRLTRRGTEEYVEVEDTETIKILEKIDRENVTTFPRRKGGEDLLVAAGNVLRLLRWKGKNFEVVDQYTGGAGADLLYPIVVDLPGAGRRILAYDKSTSEFVLLAPGADGVFRPDAVARLPYAPSGPLRFVDVDGDGAAELIYTGGSGVVVARPRSRGYSLLPVAQFEVKDAERSGRVDRVGVGDLNGDGRNDIVFTTQKDAQFRVLDLRKGKLVEVLRFRIYEEKAASMRDFSVRRKGQALREILVRDVTGDGLDDVLLLIHDRVLLYVQDKIPGGRKKS